jgi:hypothetical protein
VSAELHTRDCGEYGCAHRTELPSPKALIPHGPMDGRFGTAIANERAESVVAEKPVRIGP